MQLVPARAALAGALFAAVVTLPGLGNGTLWDNSETAYGEVAREILLTHDWVVMHLNGAAWFVQPPLYFWVAALFAKVLGVSALALRLPSALATIAMGAAVGYATARIAGGRAGTVASVVLSTSLMQAIVGRLAIMDALLDLCVTGAILWWFRALEPRTAAGLDRGKRSTAFLCGSAALALGTLAKGPVAPVIVILVIGVWLFWEHRAGTPIELPPASTLAGAGLIYLAVALPWFVLEFVRAGPAATAELIGHYTIARYTGVIENQRGPWWYYVPVLILGFFPWIAFVPAGAVRAYEVARTGDGSLQRLALTWTVVPLVFFSFAQTKLPNYVALMLPALAIVVGLWFERVSEGEGRRAAIISAGAIPLFVGSLGFAVEAFVRTNRLEIASSVVAPQFEFLAVAMLLGSAATVVAIVLPSWTPRAPYVLAVTSGALILFIALVAEPVAEALKPIAPLAHAIQARREPGSIVAMRDVAGANSLVFYTTPGVATIGTGTPEYLALICPAGDVFVVTKAIDAAGLVDLAGARGRHADVLATRTRVSVVHVDGPPCTTSPR